MMGLEQLLHEEKLCQQVGEVNLPVIQVVSALMHVLIFIQLQGLGDCYVANGAVVTVSPLTQPRRIT